MILLSAFGIANPLEIERSTALQLEMLLMFFMAPIITAFLVMGIRSAVAKPIKPLDMLAYFLVSFYSVWCLFSFHCGSALAFNSLLFQAYIYGL